MRNSLLTKCNLYGNVSPTVQSLDMTEPCSYTEILPDFPFVYWRIVIFSYFVLFVLLIYFLPNICNKCNQNTRPFIQNRIKEHLNNEHSSVKMRICACQNKDYEGIKIKTIAFENDPVNPFSASQLSTTNFSLYNTYKI